MGFKTGIVGLPNVGKSTLFNALTRTAAAQAANYPFCTIEPNSGEVAVRDPRLERLARIAGSKAIVPARMNFVDIAGLVAGASEGEGLGNRFLASIREVDAILHLLRCFDDTDIVHVSGKVDPIADAETVETELMLADLGSIEKRRDRLARKVRGGDKEAATEDALLGRATALLEKGEPARNAEIAEAEMPVWSGIGLLTAKPVLYISNVEEDSAASGNGHSRQVAEMAERRKASHVVCSAAIEEQISQLEDGEAAEFLEALGLEESGLDRVIRAGYRQLGLQTFFTVGPKEARAWTVRCGATAVEAAGTIHGDFAKGFIRAETISHDDYVAFDGEAGAREAGRQRSEGKNYRVRDGDVLHILFNV